MTREAIIRKILVWASPLVVFLGLWFVRPEKDRWLPPCPFHALTGLYCPGCGSLRALHQLVHGHLVAAFRFNPMLVLMLPVLAFWQVCVSKNPARLARLSSRATVLFALSLVIFGIARNIPAYPFTLLAPH
jgi:hypothetical protein